MPSSTPPQPWNSFFTDINESLTEELTLHCLGGFVMTMVYGLDRSTADVDVLPIGMNASHSLMSLAGQGSCYQRGTADFLNVYQKTALSSGDFRLSGKTKCP